MPRLLPGLSAEEEASLAKRIEAHDMAAKCTVVEANLPLVEPVAKRYVGRGVPLAELIQDGSLGLIRAVETYDHSAGIGFTTFARRFIRLAITHAIAEQASTIRVPRQVVDALSALQRVQRAVTLRLDGEPADGPVGGQSVSGWGTVPRARETPASGQDLRGAQATVDDRGTGTWRVDDLIDDEQAVDLLQTVGESLQAEELREVLNALTPRERKVIEQRFGLKGEHPRTLAEIGASLGLTRERIGQVEAKALVALKSCRDSRRLREFLTQP
jgi:RNA polymerase primary sigma factor